ncbi:MAG: hypothetical protein JST93_25630 [Acidobacteria bacterium]|nr:hypothetical protein [Acidobacteriota bacterium]
MKPLRNALFLRWNWKTAFLSALLRGLIFFATTWKSGWQAAAAAMAAEAALRSVTAGFYGSLTQRLRFITPRWKGTLIALILLPTMAHSIEFVMHTLRGTPHLATGMKASICFTLISTLFHLHAARQGAFLSGKGSATLRSDLRRTPAMLKGFLALPIRAVSKPFQTPEPNYVLAIRSQNRDLSENS